MLVLSRQPGESVIIDGGITVQILKVEGDTIKVGIEAPKSVSIYRKELYEEIQMENLNAGRTREEELTGLSKAIRNSQSALKLNSAQESPVSTDL